MTEKIPSILRAMNFLRFPYGEKTMKYFCETVETIKKGVGFAHYDLTHILWLVALAVVCVGCCLLYRRLGERGKKIMRWVMVGLVLADEVWKMAWLFALDLYIPKYLPLHLCSINIFLLLFFAIKPTKTVGNFLYCICLPAAAMALFFPSWTKLPFLNFMHLHSFTVHILLFAIPLMLTVGGDIRPDVKLLPKCLLLLVGLGLVSKGANLLFDTNFMFLESAAKGNPLYLFQQAFGSHLIGIPVLAAAVLLVMYLPVTLWQVHKRKKAATQA